MTDIPIKIQFVKSLSTAQPSRIVAVKADGDTAFSLWVTDKTGIPYPLKDLQNNVIITNTDGNLQITSSSTSTNINLTSSILATINSALQSGDNISELVNDSGYLTTFTETDPIFQASEASLFVSGDKFNLDNQSGINSGDQDSIVGISGTKAQFNTELTDGDFLFVGDVLDTPDATTTSKGVIKLARDLAGTADAPTVPGLANKVDKVTGKSLISDTEITRLSTVTNQDISNKVDKIANQGLISDAEKLRLSELISDTQIEVSTSTNIQAVWNQKTILFTASCTVTVPNTLVSGFGFVFRTLAGVTVTWAITAPFTWETTPTTTPEKTTGSFMRRGNTNTILLDF